LVSYIKFKLIILSGKVDCYFELIGKILKPLLNKCVTPVTCYWILELLLCDEDELKLVFQVKLTFSALTNLIGQIKCQYNTIKLKLQTFQPPVKMLVPIWNV
jgi:hypothetical protein